MSKKSEAVKKWRKSIKEKLVESMGGCCICCGYNKTVAALAFHHLNPSEKEFSISDVLASPISIKKIEEELKKCILVCQNCHCEIHAGIRDIPEIIVQPKQISNKYEYNYSLCQVCKTSKPNHKITCSRSCASQHRSKIDWEKIDIQNELKTKSIIRLSEELGCSDGAIHKRMKKLGLK